VKDVLKHVVRKKKKKKGKEIYMNIMSYPQAQGSSNINSKSLKTQENRNPNDSLIYLQEVGCLKI
jgi:hypothetical protein